MDDSVKSTSEVMIAGPFNNLIQMTGKETIMAQLSDFLPNRSEGPLGAEEVRKIDAYWRG
jgi:hypothetical protein